MFKDDAVRCEICGVEIWEGSECACGIDGEYHEGLQEAYEEKARAVEEEHERFLKGEIEYLSPEEVEA